MKTKNKSFKRLFAFLVALVMVTALVPSVIFAADSFTDVKSTDDFYENIENLYAAGVISGFPDGTFRAGEPLTRQQAAKMIAEGAGYGDHDGTGSKLTDVADLTWGRENIWALEADGVVKGFGTSKEFRPRQNITRGHVAKMIALAFNLEEGDEAVDLIDLPADEEVAEAIRVLASNGIVKGFGSSKGFRPDELVTRGQFAKMVDLAMEAADFRVVSVRAINGVTIEVRFSKPVNKTSAERTGSLSKVEIAGVRIVDRTLSEDGKVLTLSVRMQGYGNRAIDVTNAAVEVKPVRSKDDGTIRSLRYVGLLTYKDTVTPTASVERVNYNTWTLKFSEPVKGGTVTGDAGLTFNPSTIDANYFDSEIKVTIAGTAKVGEELEVTVNGVRDIAGNLIEPQPTKLKVSLEAQDEVTPEIVSIVQTGAKTFEIEFDKPATLNAEGVSIDNYVLTAAPVEGSDTIYEVTATDNLEGIRVVTVDKDKVANADGVKPYENLTKTVTFTEDLVAPKASAQYVEIDGEKYIQLTFDKKVTAGTVAYSGSYIKDYVTTPELTGTATATLADDTDNVLLLPLVGAALGVEGATYTLALSNNLSSIESDAGVAWAETLNITFTRGEDEEEPELPNEAVAVVNNIANGATPDEVKVTFGVGTENLDGASATNVANYSIAGATVESATLAAASSSQQVVTLTLVKNSNTFTGVRVITISNVKIHESTKVMDPFTTSAYSLKENVRPTVVKAELGGLSDGKYNTVTVTFSEKVTGSTGYAVYVGDEDTAKTVTGTVTDATSLVISVTGGLNADDIAAGIKVEFDGTVIADGVGNLLEATAVPVN